MQKLSERIKETVRASGAALALAAGPLCAPALATDLGIASMYQSAPAPVTSWTGSYMGFSGGSAWGSAVVPNDAPSSPAARPFELGGGSRTVTSGLNLQDANVVFGYEGDTSVTNRRSAFEFPGNASFNEQVKERWLSTFRGRVGFAHDNWLVYATGGAALGTSETRALVPWGVNSDQAWHLGWTAGGGVEVKLAQDWTAKVEYLYVGLQDKSYFTPAPNFSLSSNQRVSQDDHILRFGVNYKLPWGILDSFFKNKPELPR